MRSLTTLALVLTTAGLAACSEDPSAPAKLSADVTTATPSIAGAVLGPDGTSICNFLAPGGGVRVRFVTWPEGLLASQTQVTCPENRFNHTVTAGAYVLRTTFLTAPTLATLPLAQLDLDPVTVLHTEVVRDVQMREGQALAGGLYLDGRPYPGVALNVLFEFGPKFIAGQGLSPAVGSWRDGFFGRDALVLQTGIRYAGLKVCGRVLGARQLRARPSEAFVFPDDADAVRCVFGTVHRLAAITHHMPRMVVSAMPADLGGGFDDDQLGPFGTGWGVQFPVVGGAPRREGSASQLFTGALVVGVAPGTVLAGEDIGIYNLECVGPCRDMGQDAELDVDWRHWSGKQVTWSYTDAASAERVGLRVIQQSFAGRAGFDYVLFRFQIRNQSHATQTIYPGFFGDWDVDNQAGTNVGATELGGRLLYVTTGDGAGTHIGTLLISGAPIAGTHIFSSNTQPSMSVADQFRALVGDLKVTSLGPADVRVIHSVGPITLRQRQETVMWIAIVAGEDRAGMLASAAVADADARARR